MTYAAYSTFLESKRLVVPASGIDVGPDDLNESLFPFQRDMVRWALRKGRAAIFADTGLGKTIMQLSWAEHAEERVLILAPLGVARQTIREAARWGIEARYVRDGKDAGDGITVTNYEMLPHFDVSKFGGVVLDESSILKNFEGNTRTQLIKAFSQTPMRLCCTATPAPNDIAELANHAEFLGIMSRAEMLASFFVHDDNGWRLKGHAREPFYRWMASWSMSLKRPSDIGYSDLGYDLPPLVIQPEIVETDYAPPGQLFATTLKGITERSAVRKATLADRVEHAAALIMAEPDQPWIAWCGLNDEGRQLATKIPDAVLVEGQDSSEFKADAAEWFVGNQCVCNDYRFPFRDKLTGWDTTRNTSASTTRSTGNESSNDSEIINAKVGNTAASTWRSTTESIPTSSAARRNNKSHTTSDGGANTSMTPNCDEESASKSRHGNKQTLTSVSHNDSSHMASRLMSTGASWLDREADALSADSRSRQMSPSDLPMEYEDSTLITVMSRGASEVCSALPAISDSASSPTTPSDWSAQPCICGHVSGRRYLVSKPSIFGWGLNFQHCARMVFVGLGDSYETYYQAIRRCYRFGQTREVHAHIVLTEPEEVIYTNVLRKERDAEETARSLLSHVAAYEREEIERVDKDEFVYEEGDASGPNWRLLLGDSAERTSGLASASIDLSVFSPPFGSLYTYSNTERDLGNSRTEDDFWRHFAFITRELFRVMKPGRIVAVHCAQIPSQKARDGVIGLKDFRGDVISHFQNHDFIYHGEVCIDKDPQAQAIRTKSKGLLFTQMHKDASWSRPALADYIVLFRKPGDNAVAIHPDITNNEWIEWARPIWYGIRESDTLNVVEARSDDDERHICPLQLGTIERCIRLWSNKGETVFSPFAGIGSEGYESIMRGRHYIGIELKEAYWKVAVKNLRAAESLAHAPDLFSFAAAD